MRLAIFCPFFWKRPGPLLEIELIPCCLRHFFSALPGKGQKLYDAAVDAVHFPSRPDHLREFHIVQHPVSRVLPAGQRDTLCGRLFKNSPSYTPLEKGLDRFEGLVRCRWRSTFVDGGDELDNFSFADVMDAPMAPDSCRPHAAAAERFQLQSDCPTRAAQCKPQARQLRDPLLRASWLPASRGPDRGLLAWL